MASLNSLRRSATERWSCTNRPLCKDKTAQFKILHVTWIQVARLTIEQTGTWDGFQIVASTIEMLLRMFAVKHGRDVFDNNSSLWCFESWRKPKCLCHLSTQYFASLKLQNRWILDKPTTFLSTSYMCSVCFGSLKVSAKCNLFEDSLLKTYTFFSVR